MGHFFMSSLEKYSLQGCERFLQSGKIQLCSEDMTIKIFGKKI